MTQGQLITTESVQRESGTLCERPLSLNPIERILQKLSRMEFPAKVHFEYYLRHKWRLNHKARTLASSFLTRAMRCGFSACPVAFWKRSLKICSRT